HVHPPADGDGTRNIGRLQSTCPRKPNTVTRSSKESVPKDSEVLNLKRILRTDYEVVCREFMVVVCADIGDSTQSLINVRKGEFEIPTVKVQLIGKAQWLAVEPEVRISAENINGWDMKETLCGKQRAKSKKDERQSRSFSLNKAHLPDCHQLGLTLLKVLS